MRIYIMHCSKKKNDSLRNKRLKVTPEELYTATPLKRFMCRCKEKQVKWAILSDKYGIWFPRTRHEWYNEDPSKITEIELAALVEDFDSKLAEFDEIWFYYNPGRFHRTYRRLLSRIKLESRLRKFTHLIEIS